MKNLTSFTLASLCFALSTTVSAAGLGTQIAVRLVGTGDFFDGTQLFNEFGVTNDGQDVPKCYKLKLLDVKTGNEIGDATDCLTNITPTGAGVALTGTTFFNFKGGTVVTQGLTTVQPILHGSPDFTHITGAIPSPGDNNVIYGDRKFQGVTGTARLSGTVNLVDFPSSATFDCVFILDFSR